MKFRNHSVIMIIIQYPIVDKETMNRELLSQMEFLVIARPPKENSYWLVTVNSK